MSKSTDISYIGDVKVLAKGQVVIPKEIRDKMDISPGDTFKIMLTDDGAITIMRAQDLTASIQEFRKIDVGTHDGQREMQEMQEKIDQILNHLHITEEV